MLRIIGEVGGKATPFKPEDEFDPETSEIKVSPTYFWIYLKNSEHKSSVKVSCSQSFYESAVVGSVIGFSADIYVKQRKGKESVVRVDALGDFKRVDQPQVFVG